MEKLNGVAVKLGVNLIKVNPHNTSQNCSNCGQKEPKILSVITHSYPKCQTVLDRDENAEINILNKTLNQVSIILSACGGLDVSQPMFAQRCTSTRKKLLCLRSSRYNRVI